MAIEQQQGQSPNLARPPQDDAGKGHGHQTEIVVNGRRHEVPGNEVTFAQVVALAFPHQNPDPNIIYTVTYADAAQHPSSGELAAGGSVKVRKRTIFNVVEATKS